jgi:hypothetical protein
MSFLAVWRCPSHQLVATDPVAHPFSVSTDGRFDVGEVPLSPGIERTTPIRWSANTAKRTCST